IDTAREMLSLQVDMETGERGFVITGQEAYLEAFRGAQGRFEETLTRAKNLVSDNPPQVRKVETIAALHRRWTDEVAGPAIAARHRGESGLKDATAVIATGAGKAIMDEARRVSSDFVAVEQQLLEQRRQS